MSKMLTAKQENFCRLYAAGFSPCEAARLAGCAGLNKQTAGLKLLEDGRIKAKIEQIRAEKRKESVKKAALESLMRAALCDPSDAIKLLTMDDDELKALQSGLDLFCIAEIKRQKGGTEIKFIDRVKALEAVCRLSEESLESGDKAMMLINAVTQSADGENGFEY